MTTTAVQPPEQTARAAGVELLDRYLAALAETGYRKVAVDTWATPDGYTIRHSYSRDEWTLSCGYPGAPRIEVKYTSRATMPSVGQLMNATMPPAF